MIDDKQIIRYLDGEMTKAEKKEFEQEISANPALAEKVGSFRKLQKLAGRAISRAEDPEESLDAETREEIRQAVVDFKEGSRDNIPKAVDETIRSARIAFEQRREKDIAGAGQFRSNLWQIRRIWFSAAAVVILAIIIIILIFRPFRDKPATDLFAKYYSEFPVPREMDELSRTDDDLLFALKVYEAGDYERAIVLFDMLADSSGLRQYARFYAGHAYLHLNLTERAIETFKELLEEGPGDLGTAARWYLALCYLKSGEAALSKEQLVQIAATDSPYRKDARRLLSDLQ